MLKCIPKAGIDKLFQLILNPGTAQHRLKTEEQQANRKKIQLLNQTFFLHLPSREWLPEEAETRVPKETFLLLASI